MNNDSQDEKEQQALEALAAAALRQGEEGEITEEEIARFMKDPVSLSPAGKRALEALGADVISRIVDESGESTKHTADFRGRVYEQSAEFAAMHRKNQSGENETETERELERKRQEILARLRKKKESEE